MGAASCGACQYLRYCGGVEGGTVLKNISRETIYVLT
jgi:hypothetical protein